MREADALSCVLFWHTGGAAKYPDSNSLSAFKVSERNCHMSRVNPNSFPKMASPHVPTLPRCPIFSSSSFLPSLQPPCSPSSSSSQDFFYCCFPSAWRMNAIRARPLSHLQLYPQCLAHSRNLIWSKYMNKIKLETSQQM